MDTYGSRSLPVGGVAVAMAADRVIAKARTIAAHQLECAEDDLELVDGELHVRGTPAEVDDPPGGGVRGLQRPRPARRHGAQPDGQVTYDPPNFVFPFGTHVAVVEVDEETGGSTWSTTRPSTTAASRSTR